MTEPVEVWAAGDAYEPYVGRWSRPVAREFLAWLAVGQGAQWLDVGCGTGALTQTVLAVAGPGDASSHGKPATWVSVLKLVLGLLLLLLAVRQWHGRPRPGHEVEAPKWMGSVECFSPGKAVGAGAVLSGANPKNLLLAVGAAAAIAQTGIGSGDQAIAYVVFALIATVGVATPVVMFFALGDRSQRILAGLRDWMGQHNAVIMTVICLIIGAKLIGDAIGGFSS